MSAEPRKVVSGACLRYRGTNSVIYALLQYKNLFSPLNRSTHGTRIETVMDISKGGLSGDITQYADCHYHWSEIIMELSWLWHLISLAEVE